MFVALSSSSPSFVSLSLTPFSLLSLLAGYGHSRGSPTLYAGKRLPSLAQVSVAPIEPARLVAFLPLLTSSSLFPGPSPRTRPVFSLPRLLPPRSKRATTSDGEGWIWARLLGCFVRDRMAFSTSAALVPSFDPARKGTKLLTNPRNPRQYRGLSDEDETELSTAELRRVATSTSALQLLSRYSDCSSTVRESCTSRRWTSAFLAQKKRRSRRMRDPKRRRDSTRPIPRLSFAL